MQRRGWFSIPGVQDGDRTLAQQLRGLAPMLEEVNGKSVLDLGCAEGLIAIECCKREALAVVGVEMNAEFVTTAMKRSHYDTQGLFDVWCWDLNRGLPALRQERFDIVLALAVLHKLRDPAAALVGAAAAADRLLVIRLPHGSDGVIAYKHGREKTVDSRKLLPELGFALERNEEGPNKERVHYWRRQA